MIFCDIQIDPAGKSHCGVYAIIAFGWRPLYHRQRRAASLLGLADLLHLCDWWPLG